MDARGRRDEAEEGERGGGGNVDERGRMKGGRREGIRERRRRGTGGCMREGEGRWWRRERGGLRGRVEERGSRRKGEGWRRVRKGAARERGRGGYFLKMKRLF